MLRRKMLLYSVALLQAFITPKAMSETESIEEYDLIIVGSGLAGLTCGCLALELGLRSVVIFEKEAVIGGTSAITNGFWTVGGTELQKRLAIPDSDESLYNDLLALGGAAVDKELLKVFIKANRRQYEWVKYHGIAPNSIVFAEGKQRAHVFDIDELIEFHRSFFLSRGGVIYTSAKVHEVFTEDGKVIGALYEHGKVLKRAKASRGVVLATGGFSRNREMLKRYSPQLRKAAVIASEGATGDGLGMALRHGAVMVDTEHLKASYGFIRNPSTMDDLSLIQYSGAIIVNQDGERFVNESLPYKELADFALSQNGRETYVVFDEKIRRESVKQVPDSKIWTRSTLNTFEDIVYSAATIAEAAEKAGVNSSQLVSTVKEYNERIKNRKRDSLGREGLPGSNNLRPLVQISEPPFYVFPTTPAIIGTYCGLKVDTQARVLTSSSEPIPGLWAAGEIMGGIHGASFMMGTALAKAAAFGRIAAFSVAGKIDQ